MHNVLSHISRTRPYREIFAQGYHICVFPERKTGACHGTEGFAQLGIIIIPLYYAMFRRLARVITKSRYAQHIGHALENILF